MTIPVPLPEVPEPTTREVQKYLRERRIPRTAINITMGRAALRREKQLEQLPKGRDISIAQSDAPRQVIYGQARVGGVFSFAAISADNTKFYTVITVSGHEVESIEQIYLDDWRIDFAAVPGWSSAFVKVDGTTLYNADLYLEKNLGDDAQSALPNLVAEAIGWTPNNIQAGCAHVGLFWRWNAEIFGDGLPEVGFLVKGKQVYDPRTETTYWSDNAALCIADYLTDTRFGLGESWDRIDEDNLIAAADICDEVVSLLAGGTEKRYTCNGYFTSNESHEEILRRMAQAIGGNITYSGGKWRIWPAAWRAAALTLTEDDIVSDVAIETLVSRKSLFNRVRGTFVSAADRYQVVDYPPVVNSTYLTEDGSEELWEEINYHFVQSSATAQRLSKIELERVRQGIRVSFTAKLRALPLQVPETVALTLARYGWSSKTFEVENMEVIERQDGANSGIVVNLSLKESASGVYDWNSGNETLYDVAPNTSLPNPFVVQVPSGLTLESGTDHLYRRGDGTVFTRLYVTWDAVTDGFVLSGGSIEAQYKRSADSVWTPLSPIDPASDFFYILDVEDGVYYDCRIRFVNALGVKSAWFPEFAHLVVGKTAAPSNVTQIIGTVADYGIALAWTAVTDIDLKFYELREGNSWEDSEFVDYVQANKYRLLTRVAGSYTFLVKAIDTSDNPSATAASVTVTISAPAMLSGTFSFDGGDAVLTWASTPGSFAIKDYEVYFYDPFESGIPIGETRSTTIRVRAAWVDLRRFWIVARDIAGNESSPLNIDITVLRADRVATLTSEVIDNNVLLRWTAPPSGSLPIARYRILRGAVYESAVLLGSSDTTFKAYFEMVAGSYTYWVVPEDTAGNLGIEAPVAALVSEPPDFELQTNAALDPNDADTLDSIIIEGQFIRVPEGGGFFDLWSYLRGGP